MPVLMADPNWRNGFYYDGLPPHTGMKLARRTSHIFALGALSDQRDRDCDDNISLRTRVGPTFRSSGPALGGRGDSSTLSGLHDRNIS